MRTLNRSEMRNMQLQNTRRSLKNCEIARNNCIYSALAAELSSQGIFWSSMQIWFRNFDSSALFHFCFDGLTTLEFKEEISIVRFLND